MDSLREQLLASHRTTHIVVIVMLFLVMSNPRAEGGGGKKKKNKGNRHVRRICSCHGVCMRMEEMTSVALLTTRCEGKANSCSSLKPLHNYRSSARKRCFSPLFFFSILFTKQPFNCLDLVEHPELRRAT